MCEYEMRVILSLDSCFFLLILWSQPFLQKKKKFYKKKKKNFTNKKKDKKKKTIYFLIDSYSLFSHSAHSLLFTSDSNQILVSLVFHSIFFPSSILSSIVLRVIVLFVPNFVFFK